MLAARRNESVIGRIYELIVSTSDKNLEMNEGVFSGKKWADMDLILLLNDSIIMVDHIGAPVLNVDIKCEVSVIVSGAAPHLFRMISEWNDGINMNNIPLMWAPDVGATSIFEMD